MSACTLAKYSVISVEIILEYFQSFATASVGMGHSLRRYQRVGNLLYYNAICIKRLNSLEAESVPNLGIMMFVHQ